MRTLALTLLSLLVLALCVPAQEQKAATQALHVVPGLEIDPPQRRTRPGLVKLGAKVEAKETQKVRILWDVAARFDDASVDLEWERRGDRAVQVVVPDSSGVIVVTAWALVDGEPTSDRPARTLIEVAYSRQPEPAKAGKWEAPRPVPELGPKPSESGKGEKQEQPKPAQAQAQPARPKITTVYAVADLIDGEPNVLAAVTGNTLKNLLRKQGIDYVLVGTETGGIERLKLKQYIDDAGGHPCVIYAVGDKVRRAVKLTPSATAEEIAKGAAD